MRGRSWRRDYYLRLRPLKRLVGAAKIHCEKAALYSHRNKKSKVHLDNRDKLFRLQPLFYRGQRDLSFRDAPTPGTDQPGVAMFLIATLPTPKLPIVNTEILAACHHVICLAIARKITSCTFIARSQAASALRFMPHTGMPKTSRFKADTSCAN